MSIIKSRRHILNFYAVIGFAILFFGGIGSFAGFIFFKMKTMEDFRTSYYIILLISLSFLYRAYYTVKAYIVNTRTVFLDLNNITIGKDTFPIRDIKEMVLKGKVPFNYFGQFSMEGSKLIFNNGVVKYLYDDIYENSAEIKSFLDQVVIKKKKYVASAMDDNNFANIQSEAKGIFKGSPIFSFRGIILFGFFPFILFLVYGKTGEVPNSFLKFVVLFTPFSFFLNGWFMHYFACSKEYFVVKNHVWFWKHDFYSFKDINYVIFETRGSLPNCLRISTKDFKNKFYPAGTLSEETWLLLKTRFEENGIEVRNYSIK